MLLTQEGISMISPVSFTGTYVFPAPNKSPIKNNLKYILNAFDARTCNTKFQRYKEGCYTGEYEALVAVIPNSDDILLEMFCTQKGVTFVKLHNDSLGSTIKENLPLIP